MALQAINAYSSVSSLPLYSKSYTHTNSLSPSPLSFVVTRLKPHKTLLIPCSSPAFSPIFTSHLESHQSEIERTRPDQIGSDSKVNFSKDQVSGSNLFQDPLEELKDTLETQLEEYQRDEEPGSSNSSTIEKILEVARNLPENVTLGEKLGEFVGTVSDADCVYLLKILSQEGLVKECLYLFEWMRGQGPVLVTPRAFSVLFPALGQARMSEEIMVLIRNLPQGKRFRDVCVYNSAILGLAKCGRFVLL